VLGYGDESIVRWRGTGGEQAVFEKPIADIKALLVAVGVVVAVTGVIAAGQQPNAAPTPSLSQLQQAANRGDARASTTSALTTRALVYQSTTMRWPSSGCRNPPNRDWPMLSIPWP